MPKAQIYTSISDGFTNLNTNRPIKNDLTKFFGFYDNPYRDPFVNGNAFIFITRPMLFIDYEDSRGSGNYADKQKMAYINMTRDPTFAQFIHTQNKNILDNEIVKMLSYNEDYKTSSFLPLFTNQCKSLDANDISLEQIDVFDTKQGYKETLPTHKSASESSNSCTITVSEDANMSFTKLLTLWVNYISNISDGTFDANPDMIKNGVIDYMCSIYYFVLAPDGRTIKYYSKYSGCWPTTIPYGGFKYAKGSQDVVDHDIQFVYTVKEDMNPKILEEFNINSLQLQPSKDFYNLVNGFSSIIESPLLNLKKLRDLNIQGIRQKLEAKERDPIIVYNETKSTAANTKEGLTPQFQLIFDDYGYSSELMENIFDDKNNNYYFNDKGSNIVYTKEENAEWNNNTFWKSSLTEQY